MTEPSTEVHEARRRRYVGKYIQPRRDPSPTPVATIAQRIAWLVEAVKYARANAIRLRKSGDADGSSFAYFRAHEHVEMIRNLRTFL
jgi:hypothetical protein